MRPTVPVLGSLALLVPLVAACSVGPGAGPDLPDLATIEQAWSVEDVDTWVGGTWDEPAIWQTEDLLVSVGGEIRSSGLEVVAVDRADGSTAWTTEFTGSTCANSSDLTDGGLGAVLFRPSPDADCVGVAVVDTDRGRVVWERELEFAGIDAGPAGRQAIVPGIGIGETSIHVTAGCGRITRLDPADGRTIETLGAVGQCEGTGGIRDALVTYDEGRGDAARTVLLDTDTGDEVWRVGSDGGTTAGVVTTSPLVVDRTDADGRMLRVLGDDGRQERVVGLRMGASLPVFSPLAVADGVVVGTYDGEERVFAHDTATGETLWEEPYDRFSPERRLVGARGDELIWVQTFRDPDRPGQDETWVSASDPRDPDSGRMVGALREEYRVGIDELWFVYGDQLVSAGGDLTAFDLSAGDPGGEVEPLVEVPAGYTYDLDDDVPWTDDDVRPVDAEGACRAVTPATLTSLGLRTDLPAPQDCRWSADTPGGTDLVVTVDAATPSSDRTGAEAAAETLDSGLAATVEGEEPRDVALGDEARVLSTRGETLSTELDLEPATTQATTLAVRSDNLVVTVRLASGGGPRDLARRMGPQRLEGAAARVASDVLAGLDRATSLPEPGEDGPVTVAPADGCADTAPTRRLVPDAAERRLPPGADDRRTACQVRPPGEPYPDVALTVTAEAVRPDPLTGASAVEVATAEVEAVGARQEGFGAAQDDVDDLGDDAVVLRERSYDEAVVLVTRRDNLLVTLRWDSDALGDRPDPLPDLRRLAERLLVEES